MPVDCRKPNAHHRRPPRASLGTAQAVSELGLSDEFLLTSGYDGFRFSLHQSSSDVKDAFYQFDVHELGIWFGIDELLIAAEFDICRAWDGRCVTVLCALVSHR